MLVLYDFLVEHSMHQRTTDRAESTFASVPQRSTCARHGVSRAAFLSPPFSLLHEAEIADGAFGESNELPICSPAWSSRTALRRPEIPPKGQEMAV